MLQVYFLNSKNFDRFITKKYPGSLDVLRMHVETKLRNRTHSRQGGCVPLLRHIVFKMTEELKPTVREIPPLRTSKLLPDGTVLFEHLVEAFKANKAELCRPVVPGAIYLREIMREKARTREQQRHEKLVEFKARRQRQSRRKVPSKARTMKELKAALERQREVEEEKEQKTLLHEVRRKSRKLCCMR